MYRSSARQNSDTHHRMIMIIGDFETAGVQDEPEQTITLSSINVEVVFGELKLVAFTELRELFEGFLHVVCVEAKCKWSRPID